MRRPVIAGFTAMMLIAAAAGVLLGHFQHSRHPSDLVGRRIVQYGFSTRAFVGVGILATPNHLPSGVLDKIRHKIFKNPHRLQSTNYQFNYSDSTLKITLVEIRSDSSSKVHSVSIMPDRKSTTEADELKSILTTTFGGIDWKIEPP